MPVDAIDVNGEFWHQIVQGEFDALPREATFRQGPYKVIVRTNPEVGEKSAKFADMLGIGGCLRGSDPDAVASVEERTDPRDRPCPCAATTVDVVRLGRGAIQTDLES